MKTLDNEETEEVLVKRAEAYLPLEKWKEAYKDSESLININNYNYKAKVQHYEPC